MIKKLVRNLHICAFVIAAQAAGVEAGNRDQAPAPDPTHMPVANTPDSPPAEPGSAARAITTVRSENTLDECIDQLGDAGFCEIRLNASQVWRKKFSPGERGVTGPRSAWDAYNGAAWKLTDGDIIAYFHGGGHDNSGIIDVYEFNWKSGVLSRIYTAPPYDALVTRQRKGATEYALRHNPDLPEATHVYDGLLHDPETGLILLVTGVQNTYGFSRDRARFPEDFPVHSAPGRGIFAFNPLDVEVKGISPKQWRKVSDYTAKRFPASAYAGNGTYIIGDFNSLCFAKWKGNAFAVNGCRSAPSNNSPIIDVIDGRLYRVNARYAHEYDLSLNKIRTYPINLKKKYHGYSLSKYGDKLLFWNKNRRVHTLDAKGTWQTFKFDDGTDTSSTRHVYSKFIRHPKHDDIYLGWSAANGNPVVYRHDDSRSVKPTVYTNPPLQQQINASKPVNIKPGTYEHGVLLKGSRTVDFQNADIEKMRGNGFVVVSGGPHLIRNLKVSRKGRSGVWARDSADFTLDGFDINNQQFGIITSKDSVNVTLTNGKVRNGTACDAYGRCHNVYVGSRTPHLAVDNISSINHHGGGHLLKSGAIVNVIRNSTFDGGKSNHSRIFDFYCAERVEIRDSVMTQSPNSDNEDLISVAIGKRCPPSIRPMLLLENTVWHASPKAQRFLSTHYDTRIECSGKNVFHGIDDPCAAKAETAAPASTPPATTN